MKNLLVSTLSLLLFTQVVRSQTPASTSDNLAIQWNLIDTRGPQSRLILTVTNKGTQVWPGTGWKVFFNSRAMSTKDTTKAVIKLVNGDLQALSPGSQFGTLNPGESKKIEVLSSAIKNVSDFPVGFYLVKRGAHESAVPINGKAVPSLSLDKSNMEVATRVFNQNSTIKNISSEKLPKVFPTPQTYTETAAKFVLNDETVITADSEFQNEAELLAEHLNVVFGKRPTISSEGSKAITLRKVPGLGTEEYKLSVNANRILISASQPAGIFYGIQSLKTMLPANASKQQSSGIEVTGVEVTDKPRFPHRAFLMDVARNFQPKSQVLKVLDVMALYKLNVFHFHFSEDEGWRLEIPALPELTQVGGKRAPTADSKRNLPPSYGSGVDTTNSGSGFYSKDDFIEILKYATARHIRVIPEIESPGHARAAIKAMDARYERLMQAGQKEEAERFLLRDLNDKSVYRSVQGWDDNVINVALPSTYNFMETVVDEIRKMYAEAGAPLQTIHFGGDEVPAGVWERSPAVQNLIKTNPTVKNTNDLWYYYFNRIIQMLEKRNLYLSGWEEAGLVKVPKNGRLVWVPNKDFAKKNIHVDVWNNIPGSGAEDLAYRLANAGVKVVLSNVTNFYFDLAYNQSFNEPGLYWGGYLDVDKPFYFIPFNYLKNLKDANGNPINKAIIKGREPLTEFGKSNIVGLQGALWSETIRSSERSEYMLLPKLLGLAERAWAKEPRWAVEADAEKGRIAYQNAWSQFVNVLGKRELPRLDTYGGGFNYRIPTPGAVVKNGKVEANVQFPGFTIRYTVDGSEPTETSPVYSGPMTARGLIKLKAFNTSGRSGQSVSIKTPGPGI